MRNRNDRVMVYSQMTLSLRRYHHFCRWQRQYVCVFSLFPSLEPITSKTAEATKKVVFNDLAIHTKIVILWNGSKERRMIDDFWIEFRWRRSQKKDHVPALFPLLRSYCSIIREGPCPVMPQRWKQSWRGHNHFFQKMECTTPLLLLIHRQDISRDGCLHQRQIYHSEHLETCRKS